MKKTLTIILMQLVFIPAIFSQIKTSTVEKLIVIGKLQHIDIDKKGNQYTINYNDHKFTQINEYKSFVLSEKDFEDLYNVIIDGFEKFQKEPIMVETPNDILFLKYTKVLSSINLQITHFVNKDENIVGLTQYLTLKRTKKLFGKK